MVDWNVIGVKICLGPDLNKQTGLSRSGFLHRLLTKKHCRQEVKFFFVHVKVSWTSTDVSLFIIPLCSVDLNSHTLHIDASRFLWNDTAGKTIDSLTQDEIESGSSFVSPSFFSSSLSLNAWGRIFPSLLSIFFFFSLFLIIKTFNEGRKLCDRFFHVIFYVSIVLFAFTNLLFVNNALSSSQSSDVDRRINKVIAMNFLIMTQTLWCTGGINSTISFNV